MKKTRLSLITAAALAAGGHVHASAITGLGGSIFGTGGEVVVEMLGSTSAFDNELNFFYAWLDADHNVTDKLSLGIDNYAATFDLGTYDFGRELVFGILSPEGTFLSGAGSRNADGLQHSWVTAAPTELGFSESWIVGFEDLFRGGDRDYDDVVFRVSQKAALVPEPSSLALLALGVVGLYLSRRARFNAW